MGTLTTADQCKPNAPLHWRHNDHGGVSNHLPHDCLFNHLFRRRSKKTSKFRVTGLCAGNSPGPVNSPHKEPVTRKMFPFDDVIMPRSHYMHGLFDGLLQDCSNSNGLAMELTHWGRDKLTSIFQATFSHGFSWMKMDEFRSKFHWSLFLRVQLIIFQYWFR